MPGRGGIEAACILPEQMAYVNVWRDPYCARTTESSCSVVDCNSIFSGTLLHVGEVQSARVKEKFGASRRMKIFQ